ncbi:hypothetical protein HIM_02140 [Hirsutella minnesotensis 3608]|nr:hypothetical protein HIM_02140 [Hirsutella minnesotensis 3608]
MDGCKSNPHFGTPWEHSSLDHGYGAGRLEPNCYTRVPARISQGTRDEPCLGPCIHDKPLPVKSVDEQDERGTADALSLRMATVNDCRTARVAEILADFRTLQYYIAAAPAEPDNSEDYYTEGWVALRQCAIDGHHILECAADTRVPVTQGGAQEQTKAELKQVLLDAFSRRHEGHKIYLRQAAAQRWIDSRDSILQGNRPFPAVQPHLAACDNQLRAEIAAITDEYIYADLAASDQMHGRWTDEDPSLRSVRRWLRARQR